MSTLAWVLAIGLTLMVLWNLALTRKTTKQTRLLEEHATMVDRNATRLGHIGTQLDNQERPLKLLTDLEAFDERLEGDAKDLFAGEHSLGFQERFMVLQEQRRLLEEEKEIKRLEKERAVAEREAALDEERRLRAEQEEKEAREKARLKKEREEAEEEERRLRKEQEEEEERLAKEAEEEEKKRWGDRWRALMAMEPDEYDMHLRHLVVDRLLHGTALKDFAWDETSTDFGEYYVDIDEFDMPGQTRVYICKKEQTLKLCSVRNRNTTVLRDWEWEAEDEAPPLQPDLFDQPEVPDAQRQEFVKKVRRLYMLARDSALGLTPRSVAGYEKHVESRQKFYPVYKD